MSCGNFQLLERCFEKEMAPTVLRIYCKLHTIILYYGINRRDITICHNYMRREANVKNEAEEYWE